MEAIIEKAIQEEVEKRVEKAIREYPIRIITTEGQEIDIVDRFWFDGEAEFRIDLEYEGYRKEQK